MLNSLIAKAPFPFRLSARSTSGSGGKSDPAEGAKEGDVSPSSHKATVEDEEKQSHHFTGVGHTKTRLKEAKDQVLLGLWFCIEGVIEETLGHLPLTLPRDTLSELTQIPVDPSVTHYNSQNGPI